MPPTALVARSATAVAGLVVMLTGWASADAVASLIVTGLKPSQSRDRG